MTNCSPCMKARRAMIGALPQKVQPLARRILPTEILDLPIMVDKPVQTSVSPIALIESARSLLGTPWIHQGRTSSGVDCIGFVLMASEKAGLDFLAESGMPNQTGYARTGNPETPALLERHLVKLDEPIPGALLAFQFERKGFPKHVGIYSERGTVIHAYGKMGRVVEHGLRGSWLRVLHSVWKMPGVDYDAA